MSSTPPPLPPLCQLKYKLNKKLYIAHIHYLLSSYQVSWGPEIRAWAPSDTFATYTHTTKMHTHRQIHRHTQIHKLQKYTHRHTQTRADTQTLINTPKSKTYLKPNLCFGKQNQIYDLTFTGIITPLQIHLYLTLADLSKYFPSLSINLLFLHPFVQKKLLL